MKHDGDPCLTPNKMFNIFESESIEPFYSGLYSSAINIVALPQNQIGKIYE